MVSICAALLIPMSVFVTTMMSQDDLVFRTRSVLKQMQKADDDRQSLFLAQLRDPDGDLQRDERTFRHAWNTVRRFQLESAEYGRRGRRDLANGPNHPYREVLVHGKLNGEPRVLHVEWVSTNGKWCFHDFRDE
jgi:hypothetical protein